MQFEQETPLGSVLQQSVNAGAPVGGYMKITSYSLPFH